MSFLKYNLVCRVFQLFIWNENKHSWCAKAHLQNRNSRVQPVLNRFCLICFYLWLTPNATPKSLLNRRVCLWAIIVTYLDLTPFCGIPYYVSISPDPWSQALWCRTAITEFQWYLQFILSFAVSMHQGCQCLSRQARTGTLQIKSSDELFRCSVLQLPGNLLGRRNSWCLLLLPLGPKPLFTREVKLHLFLCPICPHKMKTSFSKTQPVQTFCYTAASLHWGAAVEDTTCSDSLC